MLFGSKKIGWRLEGMEEGCIGSLLCDDIITFILYRGTVNLLAQPTSQCILFDGENISFDALLVIYIYIYKQF